MTVPRLPWWRCCPRQVRPLLHSRWRGPQRRWWHRRQARIDASKKENCLRRTRPLLHSRWRGLDLRFWHCRPLLHSRWRWRGPFCGTAAKSCNGGMSVNWDHLPHPRWCAHLLLCLVLSLRLTRVGVGQQVHPWNPRLNFNGSHSSAGCCSLLSASAIALASLWLTRLPCESSWTGPNPSQMTIEP